MNEYRICDIHAGKIEAERVCLSGWVKTHRQSKSVAFIELSDGSSVKGLQLVLEPSLAPYAAIAAQVQTGASITVQGNLVPSPAKGQKFEMQVKDIELVGEADPESYPLQKKGHTLEFLREHMHLRLRSNTLGAVFRVRSVAAMLVHEFFQSRGFVYAHTPIISTADCEGAGEMFQVTTLPLDKPPLDGDGKVPFELDFFGAKASLTVSGQLEAEIFATALMNAYTFSPTFRAENSNTTRHLAEFWMIEPEMAFCDLQGDMRIAQEFLQFMVSKLLERCKDDLEFLWQREWVEPGLAEALSKIAQSENFASMTYTEAVSILEKSSAKFEFPVSWGIDLQSEHERYLTDVHVKGPVFVTDYPKDIKAFYMRLNDDGKTVRAMDLLVPRLGEIIGGSQREERYSVLQEKIKENGLPLEEYWWYLELRKFGTVPHAGFGLGFERLLMYVTGMQNIRDVIAFPRSPGFAQF